MNATETVRLPTAVTVGCLRITTYPRNMRQPLQPGAAIEMAPPWTARTSVTVPQPTPRHYDVLQELLQATGVGCDPVSDAHLAALEIEHGEGVQLRRRPKAIPGLGPGRARVAEASGRACGLLHPWCPTPAPATQRGAVLRYVSTASTRRWSSGASGRSSLMKMLRMCVPPSCRSRTAHRRWPGLSGPAP